MMFKKIAVLSSKESWFVPFAKKLVALLKRKSYQANLFFNHKRISSSYEVVFILSYFRIIDKQHLEKHKHNLVVHESALPKGKGWAPIFWQILKAKNKIPIVLFEASEAVDAGDIYIKDYICLRGHELESEIRQRQVEKTVELCLRFLKDYKKLRREKQRGKATFYRKRTPADSKLDINKSIREQFNLLRIVNNDKYPAFFYHKGHKYVLKIEKREAGQ